MIKKAGVIVLALLVIAAALYLTCTWLTWDFDPRHWDVWLLVRTGVLVLCIAIGANPGVRL